ncbi:Ig-like domain-containing protein [Aliikangiella sp. IMCC44653]
MTRCLVFIMLISAINLAKAELPLSLVKDYNQELVNSDSKPTGFKVYKEKVLFFAQSEPGVNSLYGYDSISGENEKLADINTTFDLGKSNVTKNGVLFVEDSHPIKLWVSDGTVTGTHVISELGNLYSESFTFASKQFQDKVIFSIAENGYLLLYKSDGTSENTILIERVRYEAGKYWDRVNIIGNDESIIASYQDNYFYFFDEDNNKHSSCFWESGVDRLQTVHGRIYFHAPNDTNLYFCDIESSQVKEIRDEVEFEAERIKMLFQNDSSIYFIAHQEYGGSRAIRYDPAGIKYSIPYSLDVGYPPSIIDGRVVFQHSSDVYIEEQLVEFPQGGPHLFPASRAVGCLQGACILRTSPEGNNAELLYVEFGSAEGEILHVFNPKAEIGNTRYRHSYGAAVNKKLVYSEKNWDLGMEPHVLDLVNKNVSLIEDIDKTIETDGSKISRIQVVENRLYVNAKTVEGRQIWSYDPSSNESSMIVDTIRSSLNTKVEFQILNKIYYSRTFYDTCREVSSMAYNLDTGKRLEYSCGRTGNIYKFAGGYLTTNGDYLDYFNGPILGFNHRYILYDNQNSINEVRVQGDKAYIRRDNDFIVLNEDLSYQIHEISENDEGLFPSYIGEGKWLFRNGRVFNGNSFVDTQLQELLTEDDTLTVLFHSGKNALISLYPKKFVYDSEKDSVSEFRPIANSQIVYHNNYLYQVEEQTGNIYRHDFNEGVDKLVTVLGRISYYDIRFYEDYLYYYSENSLKRASLISGETELLTTKFEKHEIGFDEIVNDDFGNVYFTADYDLHGTELWKLTNENKYASERNYVMRHDINNHFKFPVSSNNLHSEFKILTESQLGNIAVDSEGFSYVPNAGATGSETINFSFINDLGESNIGRLNIYVNKRPKAYADTFKTVEQVNLFDPTLNDQDDYFLRHSHIEIVEEPKHSIFDAANLSLIRDGDYIGPDSFKYRLIDEEGDASEVVQVNIDFSNPYLNSKPLPVPDEYYLDKNTNVELDILANDSDPDGDSFTYRIKTLPKNGGLYIGGGILEYRPDLDFEGDDAFLYYIIDDYGQSSSRLAEVKLHVGNKNKGGVIADSPQSSSNGGGSVGGFYLYILLFSIYTIKNSPNRKLKK